MEHPQQKRDTYVGNESPLKCSKNASNDAFLVHCTIKMHAGVIPLYTIIIYSYADLRVKDGCIAKCVVRKNVSSVVDLLKSQVYYWESS